MVQRYRARALVIGCLVFVATTTLLEAQEEQGGIEGTACTCPCTKPSIKAEPDALDTLVDSAIDQHVLPEKPTAPTPSTLEVFFRKVGCYILIHYLTACDYCYMAFDTVKGNMYAGWEQLKHFFGRKSA